LGVKMAKFKDELYEELGYDLYGQYGRESMLEDDGISAAEQGFMQGYDDA